MVTDLSWGHLFPLESDVMSLLRSHYCHASISCFVGHVLGRAVTRNSKTLGYFLKICLLIFKYFLSKSWMYMELFGNFLCCYCAATKRDWPAAVTLFFATVPMLRICSLLSCKLGQGQKHRCATQLQTVPTASFPGIGCGSWEGHKDKRASAPQGCHIHFKLKSTSNPVISWLFSP